MRVSSLSKTRTWAGPNKDVVRECKITLISQFLRGKTPAIISFPGTRALLERALVARGIASADQIVGIQTNKRIGDDHGAAVLDLLSEELTTCGPTLPLFVGEFSDFPAALRAGEAKQDHVVPRPLRMRPWLEANGATRFNVLELDVCCPFGPSITGPVEDLLRDGRVADDALLLVNHMKGREKPGLLPYMVRESARFGERCSLAKLAGDVFRYAEIPKFYANMARHRGYACVLMKVHEYRDKNEGSGKAVKMIQYFFRLRTATKNSGAAFKAVATRAINTLAREVKASEKSSVFRGAIYQKTID